MNVRRAILERLPDHLVDELDDTRLLIALGDFLVLADEQFQRLILLRHLVQRLRADAVIFFQRLLDFAARRERKGHRRLRIELHRIEHRCVERIAHR